MAKTIEYDNRDKDEMIRYLEARVQALKAENEKLKDRVKTMEAGLES